MPLQATSGTASYDAFGGGVAVEPVYIEQIFSTYLYTGTGSSQTITNNIDLSGKGGLTWIKTRGTDTNYSHILTDTVRGATKALTSNTTDAEVTSSALLSAFTSSGFTVGTGVTVNKSGNTFASWTFRKQPKFFDVVTWTATGSEIVSHNLQSVPGCVIYKSTSNTSGWLVLTRKSDGSYAYLVLNTPAAGGSVANATAAGLTSTTFDPSQVYGSNAGQTYVAYLFAHDAGGFGLTGTDNVISCGSFTTDANGIGSVNLGYEPQFLITKRSNNTGDWNMFDNMRGMPVSSDQRVLLANTSDAEFGSYRVALNATGFTVDQFNANSTFIYIAIRRGPMKVPTSGTSVFALGTSTSDSSGYTLTSNFPVDSYLFPRRDGGSHGWVPRLTNGRLQTNSTGSEADVNGYVFWDSNVNVRRTGLLGNASTSNYALQRAPGFFDVVCYTGDSSAFRAVPHNLGVAPELMIFKTRSNANPWWVYAAPVGATKYLTLNTGNSAITLDIFGNTAPTATNFYVNGNYWINFTATVVAYLFASVPGVSKVGGYTGTGTTQTINCGFTGGARFVMIKRTDNAGGGFAGDWYVWDSARGIVAGNDPYLLLNSTAAEVTNTDYIDTASTGFEISSTAPADINASGGTFIFLAIA